MELDYNEQQMLLESLEEIENIEKHYNPSTREEIIKAPFTYPGCKIRSLANIIPNLPRTSTYLEPFGGTGTVLLNRSPVKLEVFNDRWSGISDFYRCVQDTRLLHQLLDAIETSVHSRELFIWCKDTWEAMANPVERAFRWYYMLCYSYGKMGAQFARNTSCNGTIGSIRDHLPEFGPVHERLKRVIIENLDWVTLCNDYYSDDAVIYFDPPYLTEYNAYKHTQFKPEHHRMVLDWIFSHKCFCAVSGYDNLLYKEYKWDTVKRWPAFVSLRNSKCDPTYATECLFVRYAR